MPYPTTMRLLRASLVLPLLASLSGIASIAAGTADPVALGVPGRSNQTPWAASLGPTVAVAWGASTPDGATDVFLAVSRDEGRSFGEPIRVKSDATWAA